MTVRLTGDEAEPVQVVHREALERCRALIRAADALRAGGAGADPLPEIDRALEWFEREFVRHMNREDRHALPLLEAAIGQWCRLPEWMAREHRDLRAKIADLRAAFTRWRPGDAAGADRLADQATRLGALLAIHVNREERLLLPVARAALTGEQWDALGRAMT
jgi:hemerythrin-like domain-containing protein